MDLCLQLYNVNPYCWKVKDYIRDIKIKIYLDNLIYRKSRKESPLNEKIYRDYIYCMIHIKNLNIIIFVAHLI